MFICFEKRTIGEISNRYSTFTNRYLKSYRPKQEQNHIIYLDVNNLYGYVMFKFRVRGGFKWIDAMSKIL